MRDTFVNALKAHAVLDSRIFLVVGDLGYGVVDSFAEELPEQFLNAGISEQNMMGLAAGLSDSGYLPFVYSIANFPTFRCLEQIRNDVVYHELPVTIVSIGAGMGYGTLGYSHFGIEDFAILRSLPALRILSPADPYEVQAALKMILSDPRPTYLRLGKNGEKLLHDKELGALGCVMPLRLGGDILVLATGSITSEVIASVDRIKIDFGAEVSVYSVPVVKPMDLSAINFGPFTTVITLEEHRKVGGFGSQVLEYLNEVGIDRRVIRIGLGDEVEFPTGSQQHLLAEKKLNADALYAQLLVLINQD